MSIHVTEAAAQLRWWLRLPPTNLIDRGDHVRFRYALYLMIHQTATVLCGLNGLPEMMYYPSRLAGARNRMNGLPRAPAYAGDALWTLATERDPQGTWETAAGLMRDTLALVHDAPGDPASLDWEFEDGSFKPDQSLEPGELYMLAAGISERMQSLEGANIIALGGSLGRGYADRQSDIDLLVFGPDIPREEDRRWVFTDWPDVRHGPLIEQACDSVLLDGAMVHIRYWTTGTVDKMLAAFPKPPAQRILAEELQNCLSLIDPVGSLGEWKAFLGHLPDALVRAVIGEARNRLPLFRNQWQKAQDADDRVHLYCLINQAVGDFLTALYIRNGRFLSTPGWTHLDVTKFDTLPTDQETKLTRLTNRNSDVVGFKSRWRVLEDLWCEISC